MNNRISVFERLNRSTLCSLSHHMTISVRVSPCFPVLLIWSAVSPVLSLPRVASPLQSLWIASFLNPLDCLPSSISSLRRPRLPCSRQTFLPRNSGLCQLHPSPKASCKHTGIVHYFSLYSSHTIPIIPSSSDYQVHGSLTH